MTGELSRDLAERIDRACDRFESAWRAGRPGRIEDELATVPEAEKPAFLAELLAAEVELRLGDGETPEPGEYRARFPDHEVVIETAFGKAWPPRGPRLPHVPGYEIEGELGRGGMGVVYKARRTRLNRPCALKMILGGAHASAESLQRFLAEAETIARLEHPNVVRIHHIGEADGLPFFELEYIAGGSLDQRLDGTPLLPREAARLVEGLALGMAEAHRLGVVHRDLKPANVLLSAGGTPKITDFGLAKALDSESGLTRTESILGSPSYMAPEQAEGRAKQAGPASDIYALGAILYELLTGRPPFRGATALETMRQVKESEPVRPGRLHPGLAWDIETICLTCLNKDPAKRYATAAALAEDLRRFLAGEPILARPPGWSERAWRWCLRNPALAGALAGVVLLAGALVVGLSASAVRLGRAADRLRVERNLARTQAARAERAERAAEEKLWESYLAQARARRGSGRLGRRFEGLDALKKAAALTVFPDRRSELRDVAIALMTQADLKPRQAWDVGCRPWTKGALAVDLAREHYARHESDGFFHVRHLADNADLMRLPVDAAPEYWPWFSPDGRFLWVAYNHTKSSPCHRTWDLDRRQVVTGLPPSASIGGFSSDSALMLVTQRDGWVSAYAMPAVERVAHWDAGSRLGCCVLTDDGSTVATVPEEGSEISIRDVRTGQVRRRFGKDVAVESSGASLPVESLAWAAEGRLLAAAIGERIYLWHPGTGTLLSVLEGHKNSGNAMQFNHAGDLMASWGWDGTTRLWDLVGGRELVFLYGYCRGWGRDDRSLLAWEDTKLTSYEVALGHECRILAHGLVGNRNPIHSGGLWGVAFSPDGRWLAAAGGAGVVVYRADDGREMAQVMSDFCESVAFQPDGRLVTYDSKLGLARWPVRSGPDGRPTFGPPQILDPADGLQHWPNALVLDRTGQRILLSDYLLDRAVFLDLRSPGGTPRFWPHFRVKSVALSPDGRWAATGTWKSADLKVWDTATGTVVRSWPHADATAMFSPDGCWLATYSGGFYRTYRVGDWRPGLVLSARGHAEGCPLIYRPDGRLMAVVTTVDSEHAIALLDAQDGRELALLQAPGGHRIHWLAFSPDGRRLAATTSGDRIQLWDLELVRKGLADLGLDQGFPTSPGVGEYPKDGARP